MRELSPNPNPNPLSPHIMPAKSKTHKVARPKKVKASLTVSVQAGRTVTTVSGNTRHMQAVSVRNAKPVDRKTTLASGIHSLNAKEFSLLSFIRKYYAENGIMPDRRIAQHEALFLTGLSNQKGSRMENGVFVSGACSACNVVWESLEAKGELARVLASGSRGSILARDEKAETENAIAYLRSQGYTVTAPRKIKKG